MRAEIGTSAAATLQVEFGAGPYQLIYSWHSLRWDDDTTFATEKTFAKTHHELDVNVY
jgi:hypothetical protein